jgi:hypothetical protein
MMYQFHHDLENFEIPMNPSGASLNSELDELWSISFTCDFTQGIPVNDVIIQNPGTNAGIYSKINWFCSDNTYENFIPPYNCV